MRSNFIVALAVVAGVGVPATAGIFGPHRAALDRHRTLVGDWRLDTVRDRFSGAVICRLRARDGKALYLGRAVGFRFKRQWNVDDAVYRVDGGPARTWQDDRSDLVALGTPTETGGMANPSEGIVWIPFSLLANANGVTIEPRRGSKPRLFHFRGLKGLLTLAHERGCRPDSRFVR